MRAYRNLLARPQRRFLILLSLCAAAFLTLSSHMSAPSDLPPLHVITVCFNPANFSTRITHTLEVQDRMSHTPGVIHYTAELVYGDALHRVTDASNPRHLQLRLRGDDLEPPLWHKENLINLVVRKLLPPDWKAVAWLDAELTFENPSWALQTMHLISDGRADMVQPL
jgi:hypothetical protein